MIAFEMDIKEKEELGYWVFDWDENRYRLLVEYVPNELKVLFEGDIDYLYETCKMIMKEIERNTDRIKSNGDKK